MKPDATNSQELNSSPPLQISHKTKQKQHGSQEVYRSKRQEIWEIVEWLALKLHNLSIQNNTSSCGEDRNDAEDGGENKRKEVSNLLWNIKD